MGNACMHVYIYIYMKVSASSSRGPTNPLLRFGDLSGTLLRVPRAGKPLRFAGLALRNVLC